MSSFQDTLQQGDTIGCYQIEEVLGRGGFAVTYLAIDSNLDVYVAIKEYLPREIISRDSTGMVLPKDSEYAEDYQIGLENFAREAKTLALFKHPNIVRVHQVLHENNTAYMVMDYEHGQELAEVLENQKSLSEQELRPILMPVLDAVAEIHQQGYVHRDIKPSNIYLRDNKSPVLLDFGAARYTMSETTQQLTAVVTVGYTPIEQYNVSDADQGPWTDIYALSAVLYEAVTGEMPVDSVTRASTTLTNAADPLVPVRDKSLHACSDEFYNAIDWGLRMDAAERPRTVNQWLAALNGTVESPEQTAATSKPAQKSARGARPSKLRTRAKSLAATETESHHRTSVELAMQDFDIEHHPGSRIEPSFGESLDELDIDNSTQSTQSRQYAPSAQSIQPNLAVAAAAGSRDSAPVEPPVLLRDSHQPDNRSDIASPAGPGITRRPVTQGPPSSRNSAVAGASAISSANAGKSHTQEIRDVVRRDIMKRDVMSDSVAETNAPQPQHEDTSPEIDAPRRPGRILTRSDAERTQQNNAKSTDEFSARPDPIEIDQSDWDYEPPGNPWGWKWLLPATGLAAVFAASLLYVNRPDLFQFNNPNLPELTVETALERAQDKVANGQLIFPAGESALDYYQLILGSEPTNAEALAGIENIEKQVRDDIVKNVESNSLSEANRLLSRANNAGLRVDSIPAAGAETTAADTGAETDTNRVTAIDKDLSPYLKRQIAEIELQIQNGDADAAEALFVETDKYLPDPTVSITLKQRIDALRTAATNGNNTLSPNTASADPIDLATGDASVESTGTVPPITNNVDTARPYPNAEIPARAANNNNTAPTSETGNVVTTETNTDTDASVDDTPQAVDVPTSPANDNTEVAQTTRVSAPRRSYIDGRGASARHLNTLRTAIEAKSIDRVLQVSDSLPKERVEFLNQMFRRYDRLDVVIDRIRDQPDELTANLNVSMFNKRNDGSFYSAGRWNGVTVKSSKVNDEWEKIEW